MLILDASINNHINNKYSTNLIRFHNQNSNNNNNNNNNNNKNSNANSKQSDWTNLHIKL